jgi:hypothetical protein
VISAFIRKLCGGFVRAKGSLHVPETVTDQIILYQTLATLLFSAGRDHSTIRGEEYIEELSSGALRGTNPANAADRHYAIMSEAWRICTAAARANARFGTRRWAKARGGTKPSLGQADSAPPRSGHGP